MKSFFFTLIISFMCFFSNGQNHVFNKDGKKVNFSSEDLDITFTKNTSVVFPPAVKKKEAGALLSLLPTAIDWAFKTTTSILEKRVKSFTAEYTRQKSYLEAFSKLVPDVVIERNVVIDNSSSLALRVDVIATPVNGMEAFVYSIDKINLNYSSARSTKKNATFDYTFEFKVTYLVDGKKETQELSPVTVTSVGYGNNTSLPSLKYRTDLIPLPAGGVFSELSVKIIETNPAKVRAEKILATWNNNKDEIKTVINNFVPGKDDKDGEAGDGGEAGGADKPGGKPNN